jgi:hypothetical protein
MEGVAAIAAMTPEQEQKFKFRLRLERERGQAPPPEAEQYNPDVDLGRQVALGGRAVGEGVLNTLAFPGDLAAVSANYSPVNLIAKALSGSPLYEVPTPSSGIHMGLDAMGAPNPETDREGFISAGLRGAAGAATGVGAARSVAANAAGPVMQKAGNFMQQQPKLQVVSGVTGAEAGELTRQEGGGPIAQLLASLAGGLAPTAVTAGVPAVVRGAMRGTPATAERMQQNIDTFAEAGTTPTLGQATEGRAQRAIESGMSKFPGSAGVMAKKAETQQAEIGAQQTAIADTLAPQSTAMSAGEAVKEGVRGTTPDSFMSTGRAQQSKLYGALDALVPPTTPVAATNYEAMLNRLAGGIAGAPAHSATLGSGTAGKLLTDFAADTANGPLTYDALKGIRTRIDEQIDFADARPGIDKQELKRLRVALTQDMKAAATAAGPRAEQAFNRANAYTRDFHKVMDQLDTALNAQGGPEKVFQAVDSASKQGATTVRAVMYALPQEARKEFVSAIVRRLGRANPGNQDDAGSMFSTQTFLTNWNKMDPDAKAAMFGTMGPQFKRDMDSIAKVASNLRDGSKVFSNPSGTAGGEAIINVGRGVAGTLGAVAAGTGSLSSLALLLGGLGSANVIARGFTNPTFVKWLARQTKLPPGALPAQINILAQQPDQESQEIAAELQKQQEQPK